VDNQGSQLREIFELVRRVLSGIPGRKTINVVQDETFTSQIKLQLLQPSKVIKQMF